MNEKKHIEDKDWEVIAKKFYDEQQNHGLDEQNLSGSEFHLDEVEKRQLQGLVKKINLFFDLKKYRTDEAWNKLESRIHSVSSVEHVKTRKFYLNPVFRYAAAVVISAVLLISGYELVFKASEGQVKELAANDQVLKAFALPDGTKVSLNSNSKLFYPEQFGQKSREVSIVGEVFFEVKPDKTKPFIIHAGNAQVKVLGTSFNVSAYPKSPMVEVTVETGKVQFTNQAKETMTAKELILTPGEKGVLVVSSNSMQKTINQNPNFLAWKTRNLIFKATSLGEVIKDLENVYKVDIRLADPKLNGLLLTAQCNDYSLDFILKLIESTFKLEVERQNELYILKAKS